jgi:hypothetical protein
MVYGDIIHIFFALSDALFYISYIEFGRGCKPWVRAVLAVFLMTLFWSTNSNVMTWLWVYLLRRLEYAMIYFGNKYWLRWLTTVQDSPGLSRGTWRSIVSFWNLCVFQPYFRRQEALLSGCGWGRSFRNLLYRNSLIRYFFFLCPYTCCAQQTGMHILIVEALLVVETV